VFINNEEINKKFNEYIEYRLQEWANWFSKGNYYGIGFNSSTIEYRLMTEGIITNQPGYKAIHCNEEAEEIENLVNEMGQQYIKQKYALRIYYFGRTDSETSHFTMGKSQLQAYVNMAKQWFAGRLSAKMKMNDFS
jgi:hypothetical protein